MVVSTYPSGRHTWTLFAVKQQDSLLQVHNKSMSPIIAFQTIAPRLIDPELFVILQAIRQARAWLLAASEDDRESFLGIASRHQGVQGTSKGPASTLTDYLLRLGWSVDCQGFLSSHGFSQLNLPILTS